MSDIEQLIEARKWKQAQTLLQQELVGCPTDHWLWYTLSLAFHEQHKYELALESSKRAVELQPDCAWALWHYAGSLYMNGAESAALAIWNLILNSDIEKIAEGECGEGVDAALRLVNDVHYRMGRCYQKLGQYDLAAASLKKYLHNRAHGAASTYDDKAVKKILRTLPQLAPTTLATK